VIHVITGLPGSFKTTWTLRELCGSGFADRRIFAHGVNGLLVDRIEKIEADQVRNWRTLPAGSVIVVDEAQKLFPSRGMHSGKPPEWIEQLAEHRHDGYDFFLVTQHPTFLDPFVRKLAGRHFHFARRFGMERATVFQWEEVKSPENNSDKELALKSTYTPEAADYARHQSATQHTHKRRLPWKKLLLLGGAAAVVIAMGVLVLRHLTTGLGVKVPGSVDQVAGASPPPGRQIPSGRFWDAHYRKGRILERMESAPLYDALQEVKSQPRVVGCADFGVSVGERPACFCTSDQGFILPDISVHACRALIRSGWHDETRKPVDINAEQIARLNALDGAGSAPAKKAAGSEDGHQLAPAASPLSDSSTGL